MSEQFFWHFASIVIFSLSLKRLSNGFIDSTSWFCLFFAIGFSGNVLGYPLSLLEVPAFAWLKDAPATTLHGRLLFGAMVFCWIGHLLARSEFTKTTRLRRLPSIPMSDVKLDKLFHFLTFMGALLSISLSIFGYVGYFTNEEVARNPPLWIDVARLLVRIGGGILFLVILNDFQKMGRLGRNTLVVIGLWVFAGFLSGFKTAVVFPGFFILISAWVAQRFRVRYAVVVAVLLVAAYSVIEPMRELKNRKLAATARGAFGETIQTSSMMKIAEVVDRFLRRIDYTATAVQTLTANERGELREFKRRIDEYYRLAPMMAFVPRAVWPSKPLANLGNILYYELSGLSGSSVTPSQVVTSYIWGGWLGLAFNSLVWSILCTLGGQIVIDNITSSFRYAPFFLLAIAFSIGDTIMASYYIISLRLIVVIVALCYLRVLRTPRPTMALRAANKPERWIPNS